jgi:hypothetical protein
MRRKPGGTEAQSQKLNTREYLRDWLASPLHFTKKETLLEATHFLSRVTELVNSTLDSKSLEFPDAFLLASQNP